MQPQPLDLASVFARDVSSSSSEFSSSRSFPPFTNHCFHILPTLCFDVHVTPSFLLRICVTVITVPYSLPQRWISCATFLLSLTGMPYFTSHDAISLIIFRGFFLEFSLSLLIASSQLLRSSHLDCTHLASLSTISILSRLGMFYPLSFAD